MTRSLRLGRIAGAEIRVHWSIVLALPLIIYQDRPASLGDALWAIVAQLILLLSVLAHELAHTLAARRYGITVTQIVLWPLGGFAKLSRAPERPSEALLIAAAGPLANLLLAALLGMILIGWGVLAFASAASNLSHAFIPFLPPMWLFMALGLNIALGIFNLLPIYPLDGGQILRAALQMTAGQRHANTFTAGISLPLALGLGLVAFLLRDWLLIVVAALLFLGAGSLNRRFNRLISLGYMAIADRGSYFVLRGDYDRGIALLTRALQRRPGWAMGYINRGYAHVKLGDASAAWADFDRACQAQPDQAMAFMNRGFMAHALGDRAQALADYDRAIELQPQFGLLYSNRAMLLLDCGEREQALADIERAVKFDANNVLIYRERSRLLYFCGEHTRAMDDADLAFRLAARESLITDDVCLAVKVAGHLDWALAYYGQALRRLPNFAPVYRGRGDAYRVNGQLDEAMADYTRAIALAPRDAEHYILRGRTLLSRSRCEEAAADARLALKLGDKAHLRRQASELLREAQQLTSPSAAHNPHSAARAGRWSRSP